MSNTKAFYFSKTPKQFGNNWPYAYLRPVDALRHPSGPILNIVEWTGEIDETTTKIALESCTHLKSFDATEVLKKFARLQALIDIEKIKPYCSDENYSLIKKWLETGDDSLSSDAEDAAVEAARQAAMSDEYDAESAYHAARSAKYAAESAEYTKLSVYHAAKSAMFTKLSAKYTKLSAMHAAKSAQSAADSAEEAESAANNMLVNMINEATGWRI